MWISPITPAYCTPNSADIQIPQISKFRGYPNSADIQIPQICKFRRYPNSADIQIPQISKLRRYPNSADIQIPQIRKICPSRIRIATGYCLKELEPVIQNESAAVIERFARHRIVRVFRNYRAWYCDTNSTKRRQYDSPSLLNSIEQFGLEGMVTRY